MKLGVGLYHYMLTEREFAFARQCGCTDLIVHLANYYSNDKDVVKATDETSNYGSSVAMDSVWKYENIKALCMKAEKQGLRIYGIENFSPADWYDVLLDGPKKEEQMENVKEIIRNVGKQVFRVLVIISAWQEYGDIKKQQKLGEEQLVLVLMQIC